MSEELTSFNRVRRATANDAPGVAYVMQASGLDDTPDVRRVARLIPDHYTVVLPVDNHNHRAQLAGFADAFTTIASDGTLRLEVDLIGVAPVHQGRGYARQLVNHLLDMTTQLGVRQVRALVRTDNLPSRGTFASCGFQPDHIPYYLYVGSPSGGEFAHLPPSLYLFPVETLTYSGIWIEGGFSHVVFQAARVIVQRYRWALAGALIAADDLDAIHYAERSGYRQVGEFDWWIHL